MANQFAGNIGNNEKHTHVFICSSPMMESVGLSSYTIDDASKYFGIPDWTTGVWWNSSNESISAHGTSVANETDDGYALRAIVGAFGNDANKYYAGQQPAINWFNPDTRKYEYKTLGGGIPGAAPCDPLDLIEWNNAIEKKAVNAADARAKKLLDVGTNVNPLTKAQAEKWLAAIKTSQSGCVTFTPFLYAFMALPSQVSGQLCVKEMNPQIKLYLQTAEKRDNRRKIAQRGSPIIVDVPATAAGTKYSMRNSDASEPGVLPPPVQGGVDNPENSTAAPLKKHYCNSTGKWESGTQQILARLLEDLPGVSINAVDPDALETLSPSQAADPENPQYMAPFTVGVAMPMSVHGGNPNHFGPNFIDDCGGNKKEKIKVVNRSSRNFKLGDLVMCSSICGEWIVTDFGADGVAGKVFNIGKWSMSKFLVDSDAYFKDARYWELFDKTKPSWEPQTHGYASAITPTSYENKIRIKNYMSMKYLVAGLPAPPDTKYESIPAAPIPWTMALLDINGDPVNDPAVIGNRNLWGNIPAEAWAEAPLTGDPSLDTWDIRPSTRWWQTTTFDQLGPWMGGHNDVNLVGRTNINHTEDGLTNTAFGGESTSSAEFHHYFGASFPDGYRPEKISTITALKPDLYAAGYPFPTLDGPGALVRSYGGGSSKIALNNSDAANNWSQTINATDGGMFKNASDANWLQVPMDVGCLASPSGSENGQPATNYQKLWAWSNEDAGSANHFYNNIPRTYGAFYGDKLGRGWESWLGYGDNPLESIFDLQPVSPSRVQFQPLTAEFAGNADMASSGHREAGRRFWHLATNGIRGRHPSHGHQWGSNFFHRARRGRGYDPFEFGEQNPAGRYFIDGAPPPHDNVPYDGYTWNGGAYNHNIDMWYAEATDAGANLVGVVSAKCKFTCKGSEIQFITSQSLGIPQKAIVTNNTQIGGFLLGSLGGGLTVSGGVNTTRFSVWGKTTDNPYSFGTTGLWVRVFEEWPDHLTLQDPRHFAVFHYNPGEMVDDSYTSLSLRSWPLGHSGEKLKDHATGLGIAMSFGSRVVDHGENGEEYWDHDQDPSTAEVLKPWNPNADKSQNTSNLPKYARSVDKASFDVDFRVPTFAHPTNGGLDNQIVPNGCWVFGKGFSGGGAQNGGTIHTLRPASEWRVNKVRRGQLLTMGGFWYRRRTIGIHKVSTAGGAGGPFLMAPEDTGEGYKVGDVLTFGGGTGTGATIEVTQVGVTLGRTGAISDFKVLTQGKNYIPEDFVDNHYDPTNTDYEGITPKVTTTSGGSGSGASIKALVGIVYEYWDHDEGPGDVGSMTQLSLPSQNGDAGIVEGQRQQSIDISEQGGTGAYDAFFHFHNDISHTLENPTSYSSNFAQYIVLDISTL